MDHALRDPLAVEMGDLFEELIIFQSCWTARTHRALRLIIGDGVTLPVR
jgi:hypothetical protein